MSAPQRVASCARYVSATVAPVARDFSLQGLYEFFEPIRAYCTRTMA